MSKKQLLMSTIQCPNDWCGSLIPYNEEDKHVMECPHGSCACTHPGCQIATSPVPLIHHLVDTHSICVNRFPYGKDFSLVQLKVPTQGSPRRQIIGLGRDGTVFALHIHSRGMDIVIFLVCVRPAACIWPRYRVKMWLNGPPMPGPLNISGEYLLDKVKALLEPTSSPTPGIVSLEEVTSFVSVPPRFLSGYEPSKQLSISFRINKQ